MGQLSTNVFKKSNSFESFRLIQTRSNEACETARSIKTIREHLKVNRESPHKSILAKVLEDLEFDASCNDKNLKGAKDGFSISPLLAEEASGIHDKDLPTFLYHRYRYEKLPSLQLLDTHPPCVQIEPSSICNYRCKFCFQTNDSFSNSKSSHMGKMSLRDFRLAVDLIQDKVHIVSLASRGEPSLAVNFCEMLDYAEGKFLSLKINTNGSMLNDELCHRLLSGNQKTVVFSIDAHTRASYEEMRVNGKFDRVKKNLENYLSIKERFYPNTKTITRISGVYIDERQSMEGMVEQWGAYADQITFVKYNPWENPYDNKPTNISQPCSDLWRRLFIWHDLKLNPCDSDYMSKLSPGLLTDFSSLSQAWHSEQYQALRDRHQSNNRDKVSPCGNCSVI